MAYAHALKVEAIGEATKLTNDGVFRWCYSPSFFSNLASIDPDNLYKPGLLMWPSELSSSVDFRAGAASSSSQRYRLRADKAGVLWSQFMRFRHTEVAELIDDMTATQTLIDVTASGLDGTYFLEREALKITGASETPIAGGFRYTVARAKVGTAARAHKSGGLDDKYLYSTPHVLAGRLVQLVRIDLDASTAYPETVLWSGVLRNISTPDGGLTLELEADSALQLVNDSIILLDRYEGRVRVATEQWEQLQLFAIGPNVTPAGGAQLALDQKALFRVGDNLLEGTYTEYIEPLSNLFQLTITVEPRTQFAGLAIPEDLSQLQDQAVREVFSTRSDAPSNTAPLGDNTLPLSAHPGKLLLQLLSTTPNANTAGVNGAYDLGVDCLAGDIDQSLLDTDAILQWGDRIGVEFNDLYLGLEETQLELGRFIQTLLTPLLSALVQTTSGKLTVVRLEDLAPYLDSTSIAQTDILSVGIAHNRSLIDSLDKVTIEYDMLPGLQASKVTGRDAIKYRRLPPGQHSAAQFSLPGIAQTDIASMLCTSFIGRYHDPIPIVSLRCQSTVNLELGTVCKVTHPFIFNGLAGRGVTNASALIVSRREVFTDETHHIDYEALLVGLIHPRDGWISPSATVAAVPAPTASVFTVEVNDFTDSTVSNDNPFAADIDGFDVADVLELVDEFGTQRATGLIIQGIAGNQITLTAPAAVTPAAGDIVRPARYAQAVTSQQDDWIFVANASNQLDGDLPKTYRT